MAKGERNEYFKEYHRKNKEKDAEYRKKYYKEHKEEISKYHKERYQKNKDNDETKKEYFYLMDEYKNQIKIEGLPPIIFKRYDDAKNAKSQFNTAKYIVHVKEEIIKEEVEE